jgi:hypothetical protein
MIGAGAVQELTAGFNTDGSLDGSPFENGTVQRPMPQWEDRLGGWRRRVPAMRRTKDWTRHPSDETELSQSKRSPCEIKLIVQMWPRGAAVLWIGQSIQHENRAITHIHERPQRGPSQRRAKKFNGKLLCDRSLRQPSVRLAAYCFLGRRGRIACIPQKQKSTRPLLARLGNGSR